MCDRMLQDSLRCYRDPGPGRGVGRGFGLAECGEARVCGGAGRGLAGWDGDSGPGRGVCGDSGPGAGWDGIRTPGAGWGGDSSPARGGVGIRAPGCGVWWGFRPGAGWSGDSGPGAGWGGDSDPGAGWSGDSGPSAGWGGDFWGKMGNFLPFCRFFAVWVEISGQRNLESLPFPGKNGYWGRDFRTMKFGISTFFRQKWLFG